MSINPFAFPCACSALRQATRAVSRHYEACLAPTGATTTQFSILAYLQRESPSPLMTIAGVLELERTSLYRALRPLARDGLVALDPDPDDARAKLARLTPDGVAKILEILPHWRRAQASFLEAVGAPAWSEVSRSLDDLRGSMASDPRVEGQLPSASREAGSPSGGPPPASRPRPPGKGVDQAFGARGGPGSR